MGADDLEQPADEALRRPVGHADAAARTRHAQHLACSGGVVRREHHTEGGQQHRVEAARLIGQRLGVGNLETHVCQALGLGAAAALVEQRGHVVGRGHVGKAARCRQRGVAGAGGDEHVVSSAPGITPADDGSDWLVRMRDDPKPIPITYSGGMFEAGRGLAPDEATAVIVCGFIACDLKPFNPLIEALPRLLHLPAEGVGAWVAPMLEHAATETGARRAGSAALLQRISEMVFVNGARRYLDSLPLESRGWLCALRDRQVGRAIALMHGDPAEPWTFDELGRRVGLSRSALHERFVALTGMPPMQYLTNWRMQCGARLLRESHQSVAAVALEIGYDSEAAFSRAFKRATGLPPATWRRLQTTAAGAPTQPGSTPGHA